MSIAQRLMRLFAELSSLVVKGNEKGVECRIKMSRQEQPVVNVETLGIAFAILPRLDYGWRAEGTAP